MLIFTENEFLSQNINAGNHRKRLVGVKQEREYYILWTEIHLIKTLPRADIKNDFDWSEKYLNYNYIGMNIKIINTKNAIF